MLLVYLALCQTAFTVILMQQHVQDVTPFMADKIAHLASVAKILIVTGVSIAINLVGFV